MVESRVRSRALRRAALPALGALLLIVSAAPVAAKPPDGSMAGHHVRSDRGLGEADRATVASAAASGKKTVTLLIAAETGRLDEAAGQLRALGGIVRAEDEAVGYLKVEIATGKAEEAANVDAVAAVDVDRLIYRDDPSPNGAEAPTPQTPPGAATPRNNPYLPIGDTGAAQFTQTNPTWDGRGAVIAILDFRARSSTIRR